MARGIQRDNLYRDITDKIVAELEQGIVPWVQPWSFGHQFSVLGLPITELIPYMLDLFLKGDHVFRKERKGLNSSASLPATRPPHRTRSAATSNSENA